MRWRKSLGSKRKKRQQKLNFTALDLAAEGERLEQGLKFVARLLLERWEIKHAKMASCEKDHLGEKT
jgi:hypothetical protein